MSETVYTCCWSNPHAEWCRCVTGVTGVATWQPGWSWIAAKPLTMTGILCSPAWVLNQDDDEGEDEHDDAADGNVPCDRCKGSGYYVGLVKREHCDKCDGAGFVDENTEADRK